MIASSRRNFIAGVRLARTRKLLIRAACEARQARSSLGDYTYAPTLKGAFNGEEKDGEMRLS